MVRWINGEFLTKYADEEEDDDKRSFEESAWDVGVFLQNFEKLMGLLPLAVPAAADANSNTCTHFWQNDAC